MKPFLVGEHFHVLARPRTKHSFSMHPYLPIEKNEDGTGGGIRLRIYGKFTEPYFVDVVWGERTEIEIFVTEEGIHT